ncbi:MULTISPECIES: hypothetical protein [Vibrio harveyi group]|uniref:hypothetical protein n=1 Tax=Vibrio harveyi group TaxID=717610 RepID=UPI00186A94D1|nr:hypothetical protein [Vibrio parahaemolyticus]EHW0642930.1 hypothetical protein [Vibrio parahaemolyticus]EHZ2741819.1 hypothetical protein [Vibrio parahaemolyticus]EJB8544073.1 hypothetical protein [Vibrio parahaemolyticus]ELB7608805.1 hypothetical protein [Vibrio parahaemolyticus]MBE3718907.1 hypothetical protein [Vibrio parahaemolyticus]
MKLLASLVLGISAVFSAFFLNGGLYRTDTIQVGLVHKTNILTGEISLCRFDNGCQQFSTPQLFEGKSIISVYRRQYPQYNDLSNDQLAKALYKKLKSELNLTISEAEFIKIFTHVEQRT